MFYKTEYILLEISAHISNQEGWNMGRIGDGDLKVLRFLLGDQFKSNRLKKPSVKFDQQGIPLTMKHGNKVLKLYTEYLNTSDYVSSFNVYNEVNASYWPRTWKHKTRKKVVDWKRIYKDLNVTNTNYISPEIGVFMFLTDLEFNLIEIIEDRNVCLITPFINTLSKVRRYIPNTELFQIPGRGQNHHASYESNLKKMKKIADDFEVILIGGGVWGRGYSMELKRLGRPVVDIGQVFDIWNNTKIPRRIKGLIRYNGDLTFKLTNRGKEYIKAI